MSENQTIRELISVTCDVEISYTGDGRDAAIEAARDLHLDMMGATASGTYGAKLRSVQVAYGTRLLREIGDQDAPE